MKPEMILIAVTLISMLVSKLRKGIYEPARAARIGMASMLILTGVGHFLFTNGMSMMLPDFIPAKAAIVYITGIAEFAAAACLLADRYRTATAWTLIAFFILITPANINAAMHYVDLQKGTYDGPGPDYLWYRIPMQVLFIGWVYFSALTGHTKQARIGKLPRMAP